MARGLITIYKCTSLNFLINVRATVSRCFSKICAGRLPSVFRFRAGSLDIGDAPASLLLEACLSVVDYEI
jgi:hypothetical protein